MKQQLVCFVVLLFIASRQTDAVELRQVVSREHPAIVGTGQGLAVGGDGSVYVYGGKDGTGYVLRISQDGQQKFGTLTTYAITGVAARDDGTFATSNAHFSKSVNIYDRNGLELGTASGFTGNDQVGWDGPGTIEVGSSGDFFALDQHAARIVRINTAGQIVRSYALAFDDTVGSPRLWTYGFRVHEPAEQFYFVVGNELQCRGFDGALRWSVPAQVSGDPWGGFSGGFDVDRNGNLYLSPGVDSFVHIFEDNGHPAGEITLRMGEREAGPQRRISHLRVRGNELIVRQSSPTELFQAYDLTTGALLRAVSIEHEELTVSYPEPVWIAGSTIPLAIRFEAAGRDVRPQLAAWLRPLGTVEFARLNIEADRAVVPADLSGLFQLRVCAGLNGSESEYQVDSVVEIRPPNAIGSVSIFTPLNRRSYRSGEPIAFSVRCRTAEGQSPPANVDVVLLDRDGHEHGRISVAIGDVATPATAMLTPAVTSALAPGEYRLTTRQSNWTVADQYLLLGDGVAESARILPGADGKTFYRVRHGDYTMAFPEATFFNAPERVAQHVEHSRELGQNLFVDRLGHGGGGGLGELPTTLRDSGLISRLEADPIAVAPEKAEFENRILQTVAAYGAAGIEQRAILLYMDAGLPLGTLFDQRTPDEMQRDVSAVTEQLAAYPAFGGWSWAANWWIEKRGADMAATPEERAAYEAAMAQSQSTGRWDPILDTVSDRWIGHAIEAERLLSEAMRSAGGERDLISAMTAPYRQPGMIPPLTFANADEVDLHFQAEQIQWPMISAHHVDFYQRPGVAAWGHPELWNDDGTGAQILSNSLQMVMRGADGVGQSGSTRGFVSPDADPRGMGPGATSVHRQLNAWLARYGSWLAESQPSDPIAIPVSTRMLRLELGWQGIGGFYFTRLFEAYNACLRAHRPASFVFAEDSDADSLKGFDFDAVLLVSQTVELDPQLHAALTQAAAAGVPIYVDPTCREEVVAEFSPRRLDLDFTQIERDTHVLNDDSAFWRYRDYMLDHAAALDEAMGEDVPPIAECPQPEVLLTDRIHGDIRILWAVNDAAIPVEPGHLWRVSLAAGSRMPVITEVRWPAAAGCDVYELISGERVESTEPLMVDLRHAPARVFVAVPAGSDPAAITSRLATTDGPATFAARLRDVVVSRDQRSALVTAAGWDCNAFVVDVESGSVLQQDRIGHHFTYAPQSTATGFAVQGYDLNTAEGYHLCTLSDAGTADRRFALYGLPKRGTSWASARLWQEPINQFAVAPGGDWIASAGDLGLSVWSHDGMLLWSDDWWAAERRRLRLLAANNETLVVYEGSVATAIDARTGEHRWSHSLGESGELTGGAASRDGISLTLRSTDNGGRIFIIRNGDVVSSLCTPADEIAITDDGRNVAASWQSQLRMFDSLGGLLWSAAGDDILRGPQFNPAGDQIAVGSELGTLYVFGTSGELLHERDCGSLPVAAWLDTGDLLVATWLGQLTRLDSGFNPIWSTTIESDAVVTAADFLAADETPTSRMTNWGNAADEPASLASNLLTDTEALIEAWCEPTTHGDPRTWHHDIALLHDGDPAPPESPWLEWTDISYLDSGWREKLVVQVDTFRSQIRLDGITIVEDPDHPESWTRDTRLQWWDAATESWRDGPYLLHGGEAATHTHWFDEPLEGAKFRFVSTGGASWPVGNLRWGELVFHGEVLGPSHPDAVANRPVAVLFDEQETDLKSLMAYGDYPFEFRYDTAFSGGKCLGLSRAGMTAPNWRPPFGHVLPNWDFTIVEQPEQPGEYRWLEFAWKAGSPSTTGITLRLGPHHGGGVSLSAGQPTAFEGAVEYTQSETPPLEWQTVRVDLWELNSRQSFSVRSLSLAAVGDGAVFDHIRLARTADDLDRSP